MAGRLVLIALLLVAGVTLICLGVAMVFGPGWATLAAGVSLVVLAGLLASGGVKRG